MSRLTTAIVLVLAAVGAASAQTAKVFPPPGRTEWKPTECRATDPAHSTYASRATWRSLHSDEVNTDEVSLAYPPMFEPGWLAEPSTWNPTGPVFDDAGNLYFAPFSAHEDVVMISLEPVNGTRRWAIPRTPGTVAGSGTPLVLDDPDHPGEQIVYLGLYQRVLAVDTDGTVVWDQPTGLPGTPTGVFGVNYHPGADAIVGLSRDGYIYAVDRRTGVSILPEPFQLPGEISPPAPPSTTPPAITACAQAALEQFVNLGGQLTIDQLIGVLAGNGAEVANYFSIDGVTGRLWVGATAPDAEDGTVDGISELGALYRLELGPAGITETCHASFEGGTASTPASPRDGSRTYVGDNIGNLIAVGPSCERLWTLPLGSQIRGSIGVAADNREVYASTMATIHQVIDDGTSARRGWDGDMNVFDLATGQISGNADIAGIGANGIAFQAGAGYRLTLNTLFTTTGLGILDRLTGKPRWFVESLDETVAVMSSGPDGALYIGNSPLRRLYAKCLSDLGLIITVPVQPAVGGIQQYEPVRWDLFLRDVVCAGADRAKNMRRERRACPASYAADQTQLGELLVQARRTLDDGIAAGDVAPALAARIDKRLDRAETKQARGRDAGRTFQGMCKTMERALR
jgi:hypothetical protein